MTQAHEYIYPLNAEDFFDKSIHLGEVAIGLFPDVLDKALNADGNPNLEAYARIYNDRITEEPPTPYGSCGPFYDSPTITSIMNADPGAVGGDREFGVAYMSEIGQIHTFRTRERKQHNINVATLDVAIPPGASSRIPHISHPESHVIPGSRRSIDFSTDTHNYACIRIQGHGIDGADWHIPLWQRLGGAVDTYIIGLAPSGERVLGERVYAVHERLGPPVVIEPLSSEERRLVPAPDNPYAVTYHKQLRTVTIMRQILEARI